MSEQQLKENLETVYKNYPHSLEAKFNLLTEYVEEFGDEGVDMFIEDCEPFFWDDNEE